MAKGETVEGMQALLESMEGLTFVLRKTLLARALRKACEIIAVMARQLAPNDPRTVGNRIASAIKVAVREQTATGAIGEVGVDRSGYAGIFAEKGTRFQRATPFLQSAFDRKINDAYDVFEDVIAEGLEKEFYRRAN